LRSRACPTANDATRDPPSALSLGSWRGSFSCLLRFLFCSSTRTARLFLFALSFVCINSVYQIIPTIPIEVRVARSGVYRVALQPAGGAGVIRAGAHMVQPRLRHPLIPIRPVPSELSSAHISLYLAFVISRLSSFLHRNFCCSRFHYYRHIIGGAPYSVCTAADCLYLTVLQVQTNQTPPAVRQVCHA